MWGFAMLLLWAVSTPACSFTADTDIAAIEALKCGPSLPCPTGARCAESGYCASDADVDISPDETLADAEVTDDATQVDVTQQETTEPELTDTQDTAVDVTDEEITCASPLTMCSGVCVDLETSNANCAACGARCDAEQACVGGSCVCAVGRVTCDSQCVNPLTDSLNCGACGRACAGGDGACYSGACRCLNVNGVICVQGADHTVTAFCNRKDCVLTCESGFADCNMNGQDGCESLSPCN
ncbi:MAG: hypothetical protein CO108_17400 [Deltaproteobacteria bacterium CG_4_9_14_3_um_filter_63_12]|nr:MAG: hypothetical protein CO108_17400 [Deltaproteobacteria bacterium CG_4_9_14_3_um_filter_63_12]